MAETRFCPQCGAAKAGEARFCSSCGLSFDVAERPMSFSEKYRGTPFAQPVEPPPPPQPRSSLPLVGIGVMVLLIVAGVAIALAATGRLGAPGIGAVLPTPTSTPVPRPTETLNLSTPRPDESEGYNLTAAIGEAVPLQRADDGTELGTVTVLSVKRYRTHDYAEARKGHTYVGVKVRYVAKAGFSYNPFDWVAHDADGTQYEYDGFADLEPELDSGTLASGRKREGWISFEIPLAVAHLWIDYQNADGSVVFSVKLY